MSERSHLSMLEDLHKNILDKTEQDISSDVELTINEMIQKIEKQQKPNDQQHVNMERISNVLNNLSTGVTIQDVGTVQHIGNSVANLSGFQNIRTDDLVTFSNGVQGLVLDLESESVNVNLLGTDE